MDAVPEVISKRDIETLVKEATRDLRGLQSKHRAEFERIDRQVEREFEAKMHDLVKQSVEQTNEGIKQTIDNFKGAYKEMANDRHAKRKEGDDNHKKVWPAPVVAKPDALCLSPRTRYRQWLAPQ